MEFQTTALQRARHQLESDGRFPGGVLAPDISESWLRSLSCGLDPLARHDQLVLAEHEARERFNRHADLIRFARPELELLFDQIAGSNFMIALGSPDGVVLDRLVDSQFTDSDAGRAIIPGSVWTENLRGTNAFGLCLVTGRPAQVYGGEHFLRAHSDVSCISAPIFDGRGNLAGLIDASSRSTVRQQHTAALVQMAAGNIENSLLRLAHDRRIVLQFHPRPEYLSTLSVGMLVLDEDFTIHAANRRGTHFLTGFGRLVGAAFSDIFDVGFEDVASLLTKGETLRLRDRFGSGVSVRCVANRASFSLAVRPTLPAGERPRGGRPVADRGIRAMFRDLVIEDADLRRQVAALPDAVRRKLPIAVTGETGTGKEIMARLAHTISERRGAFVALDARMLAEDTAVAALVGNGADRAGWLDRADGGTLYIDEIAALPPAAQAILARFIDLGEFVPLGTSEVRRADILIVSSSVQSLDAAVGSGRLMAQLRFRPAGFSIALPPLRARQDIAVIARHMLAGLNADLSLDDDAVALLCAHDWPGNMHELRASLSRAALLAETSVLSPNAFPQIRPSGPPVLDCCPCCRGVAWKEQQCRMIRAAVRKADGNIALAAREIGMSRTTVYRHV